MKTQELLSFKDKEILFTIANGEYFIGMKSVLDALGLAADSSIRRTQRDRFMGSRTVNMTVQSTINGKSQGRMVTCLPEKYIYGWLGFLKTDNPVLDSYKEEIYEILYNHFKGTIVSRKGILENIKSDSDKIYQLEMQLKQNDIQKELLILKNKIKKMNRELKLMDKELVKQPELFTED